MQFLSNFNAIWQTESNICASVLLNLLNLLPKNDKYARQASYFIAFPQLV